VYQRCGKPLSPAGGGLRGWTGISRSFGRLRRELSRTVYSLNIHKFVQTIAHYAMNGGPNVGFKMKIRIHNEGVVEAVDKSSPPPAPPPAGDM